MQITEEQRKRIEANRLAAIAKRHASLEMQTGEQRQQQDPWRFFTCRKATSVNNTHFTRKPQNSSTEPASVTRLPEKFRVSLEICSPDSFAATPIAMRGFTYPGEEECLRKLSDLLLDVIPLHYTQNHSGRKACVYKLRDYTAILACLKKSKGIEVEEIPWVTYNVIEKLSHSIDSGRWEPSRPEHFTDEEVDNLMGKLPKSLLDAFLPFQLDGVRFALQRGGRCLIADEMGLGKTLQAIAIAGCFMDEGSILVVCPAVLRFSWAEELERWLPGCLPSHIHLVFGHQNNPDYLTSHPKIVVISYTMLHHLRKCMLEREWTLLIVDESHHLRCSKKKSDPEEVRTVLDVAANVKRIVLLSGTPSLSR